MKASIPILLAAAMFLLAGCVSTAPRPMGCGKCGCKMMQASGSNPHQCALCGHSKEAHNQPGEAKPGPGEHQH